MTLITPPQEPLMNPPQELNFDTLFDTHLEMWDTAHPYLRAKDRWICSSIGYCLRRQQYERSGVLKGDIDLKTLRTFAWGRYLHNQVRRMFDDMGVLITEEHTYDSPELQFSGHIDAIVGGGFTDLAEDPAIRRFQQGARELYQERMGPPPYPVTGVEIKSASSNAMKKLYREKKPYRHQLLQLGGYFVLNEQTPYAPEIADWRLLTVGKDYWGLFSWPLTQEAVAEVESRVEALNTLWSREILAPCECGTGDHLPPKYCAYFDPTTDTCCNEALASQITWEGKL